MLSQLTVLALVAEASADCTRAYLKNAANAFLNSQIAGDIKSFSAYSVPNVTLTENFKPVNVANSTLTIPLKVDYHFSAFDTTRCATFTEIIAASNPHPYITHTRIEYGDNNGKAALVESIVTDQGDWIFNATKTLAVTLTESWPVIPEAQRDTRITIQAVGDAYWDRFANASVVVPWGAPCYRLEGSEVVSGRLHNDTGHCEMSWPRSVVTPFRRYVVDEELGFVDVYLGFPGLDRTQGDAAAPDSHAFRVEAGRIKYLHTASECVVAGCGLNGTTRPPLDPPLRLH